MTLSCCIDNAKVSLHCQLHVQRADKRQIKLLSPLRAADKVIISAEGVREVIISADVRQ
jgi:hypothetical protein